MASTPKKTVRKAPVVEYREARSSRLEGDLEGFLAKVTGDAQRFVRERG
jgi:hypothetical protein